MNIAPGEEVGTKLVRLLYFVGAGCECMNSRKIWLCLYALQLLTNGGIWKRRLMPVSNKRKVDWMNQLREDLEDLLQALTRSPDNRDLCLLAEKSIRNFEEYFCNRALLAQYDAPSFLSPSWCTSFENAFLWIGGCRPSLPIHLVYSLSTSALVKPQPATSLIREHKGDSGDVSADQLNMINTLYCKAVKEEEKLSNRMANLQENIATGPLAIAGKNWSQVGQLFEDVVQALDAHSLVVVNVLVDADKLRLSMLKELIGILTPLQSIYLLAATKKLHISMNEWGKRRSEQMEKNPELQLLPEKSDSKTSTGMASPSAPATALDV